MQMVIQKRIHCVNYSARIKGDKIVKSMILYHRVFKITYSNSTGMKTFI